MNTAFEGEVMKAVQKFCVDVDKEELIKALQYDRNQYKKGYADRDAEIVRCKDCKHSGLDSTSYPHYWCSALSVYREADGFCSDGERKD